MPTRNESIDNYNPLAFLNPLRFVGAILIATIFHVSFLISSDPLSTFFFYHSNIFVEMFFLISGIMFFLFYFKKLKSGKLTYKQFWKNRVIRIFPIMIIATVLLFLERLIIVLITKKYIEGLNLLDFVLSLFLGTLSPLGGAADEDAWFITVLLICYLIACLFTWILKKNKTNSTIAFLFPLLLGLVLYFTFKQIGTVSVFNNRLSRGLIVFFAGFYLGQFLSIFKIYHRKKRIVIRVLSAIFLLIFISLVPLALKYDTTPNWDLTLYFGLAIFPCLFILLYDVKFLNKCLTNKIFTFVGKLSFPIYLFNAFILLFYDATLGIETEKCLGGWFWCILLLSHIAIAIIWCTIENLTKKAIIFKK